MAKAGAQADSIFCSVIEIASAEERATYLDQACGQDVKLRHHVEQLLDAHFRAGSFLGGRPGPALVATTEQPITEGAGTIIGSYKLLEKIGEGGFGVVFMAAQLQPVRRKVALKVLKPGMDTRQVIVRFEAERQALALMDHPNIAHVFDGGQTSSGRPYFVMELVRGLPITEYCDQNQLKLSERLELFVTVCQAVQHAHQKGVIHRDLKPSNILIASHDGTPVPKVIDFGIAKAMSGNLTDNSISTHFAQMIGTPLYMSPEQAGQSSLDVDTRSDIYSLGVLLYELLTGSTPCDKEQFRKLGYDQLRRIICETEPPKPSTRFSTVGLAATTASTNRQSDPRKLSQQIRGELDWIVMKSLEKDRNRRYETASNFAADVKRYLNDEPVQACPPSPIYRLRKFARRNKGVLVGAMAVLMALSAGLAGTTLALFDAQHQRDAAEKARIDEGKQREQAQRNEQAARKAVEESQLVLTFFLEKVLDSCRPDSMDGIGKDVTVRKAIDAAERNIAHSFQDRPIIEALIRQSLGNNYYYRDEPELAITQLKRVVEIRKVHSGSHHPATLDGTLMLAGALKSSGNLTQALALCEEVCATRWRSLDPDHPDTLSTMWVVARSYSFAGKYDQALALFEQIQRKQTETLGLNNRETQITAYHMAVAYFNTDKEDQGLQFLKQRLETIADKLGPNNLWTLSSMHTLGRFYIQAGRFDLALPASEKAFQKRKERLGPDNTHTLNTMSDLGLAHVHTGNVKQGLRLMEDAANAQKEKLGPDNKYTVECFGNLVRGYLKANQPENALPLLRPCLAGHEKQLGPKSLNLAEIQTLVALDLMNIGLASEAEPILRKCLAIRSEVLPDDWRTFNAQSMLGGSLVGQKTYGDEAEVLLLDGYQGMKEREAKIPKSEARLRLPEALARLVQLYEAKGQNDKAREWQQKLEAHRVAEKKAAKPKEK